MHKNLDNLKNSLYTYITMKNDTINFLPKFTQKDWWRDGDGFVASGKNDDYVTIADFDCSADIDIDEREANKNLAIAAPHMFAALKNLVERDLINPDDGDHYDEVIEALKMATIKTR
tara:strand:+ start:151 stop:501 length:351 start_codon:yes stop_codon:yes gene_type:complete